MLKMEVQFRGERNVASKMTEFLPGKTAKQIRDKRATLAHKKKREEVLAHQPEQEQYEIEADGNIVIGEIVDKDQRNEAIADVSEEGNEIACSSGDPPHQEEVKPPRIIEEASDSPPEAACREGIAKIVLEGEPPLFHPRQQLVSGGLNGSWRTSLISKENYLIRMTCVKWMKQ